MMLHGSGQARRRRVFAWFPTRVFRADLPDSDFELAFKNLGYSEEKRMRERLEPEIARRRLVWLRPVDVVEVEMSVRLRSGCSYSGDALSGWREVGMVAHDRNARYEGGYRLSIYRLRFKKSTVRSGREPSLESYPYSDDFEIEVAATHAAAAQKIADVWLGKFSRRLVGDDLEREADHLPPGAVLGGGEVPPEVTELDHSHKGFFELVGEGKPLLADSDASRAIPAGASPSGALWARWSVEKRPPRPWREAVRYLGHGELDW